LTRATWLLLAELNSQDVANIAWAFATGGQVMDEALFVALARAGEPRLNNFNAQELSNTSWAFATVG